MPKKYINLIIILCASEMDGLCLAILTDRAYMSNWGVTNIHIYVPKSVGDI